MVKCSIHNYTRQLRKTEEDNLQYDNMKRCYERHVHCTEVIAYGVPK